MLLMDYPVETSRWCVLESGFSVVRQGSLKSTKVSRIYCKTNPYCLGLLMLSSPLFVRDVSIVLRVARNKNSLMPVCLTFKDKNQG
jgi:hypothetical protein